MGIISGFAKMKNYILTSEGYKLLSRWTSSQTVHMGDGSDDTDTVEYRFGAMKGITTSTNVSETGYAADAKTVSEINQSLTYIYQSILGLNNAEMLDACSFYYNAFEVKVNIYCRPIAAGHISILNVGNLKPQIINYLSCSSSKSDSTAMCQINSNGQIIVTNASIGEYLQIGGSWVR